MLDVKKFFEESIKKSVGCTDPAAIGLSVSIAFHAIEGKMPSWLNKEYLKKSELDFKSDLNIKIIKKVIVELDKDTYRNALQVVIPHTGGIKGCENAAALGLLCNPDKRLELYQDLTNEKVLESKKFVEEKKVKIIPNYNWEDLHIETEILMENHKCKVLTQGEHSNITLIEVDNKILYEKTAKIDKESPLDEILKLNLIELINIIEILTDDSKNILEDSIKANTQAYYDAEKQFKLIKTKSIGSAIKNLIDLNYLPNDLINSAKYKVATAIEGRMVGFNLKIRTCAGSGNMGLISTLTLIEVAERFSKKEDKLIKALALTHLIANYVSKYSGILSALCGCCTIAGIGLAAGIAYYLINDDIKISEKVKIIGAAINNMIGSITGIICDGANKTCALKALTAVDAAITNALLSIKGIRTLENEGIVNKDPILSIKNIKIISKGMMDADKIIIKEILNKNL